MKFLKGLPRPQKYIVAPFAGAWIEIVLVLSFFCAPSVAPFAGAWIEILFSVPITGTVIVAPFAGAWIEISVKVGGGGVSSSRSLRGSVD